MSKVLRNDFVVRCTPEQAFDYLADLCNEPEWNPELCESVEKTTDGPVGLGTKFEAQWKGGPPVEVEITHFDRPNHWRAHSAGSLESNFQGWVEPHPEGARVRSELKLTPHGIFKLFFPIFKLIMAKHEKGAADLMRNALNERYAESRVAA